MEVSDFLLANKRGVFFFFKWTVYRRLWPPTPESNYGEKVSLVLGSLGKKNQTKNKVTRIRVSDIPACYNPLEIVMQGNQLTTDAERVQNPKYMWAMVFHLWWQLKFRKHHHGHIWSCPDLLIDRLRYILVTRNMDNLLGMWPRRQAWRSTSWGYF